MNGHNSVCASVCHIHSILRSSLHNFSVIVKSWKFILLLVFYSNMNLMWWSRLLNSVYYFKSVISLHTHQKLEFSGHITPQCLLVTHYACQIHAHILILYDCAL